jgi:serine O-acetyltransferase
LSFFGPTGVVLEAAAEALNASTNGGAVLVVGGIDHLLWRLGRQLDAFSPRRAPRSLAPIVEAALPRVETSFSCSALPGYRSAEDVTQFDPAMTDQYAMFLWRCSNEAWRAGDLELAADLFGLNKGLNALVCMWDTPMPPVFLWIHCVGMVLGKAAYGDRFVAYQNVTVGTDRGARATLGTGTILFAGAKVVGGAAIGERSVVSPNSVIIAETIPPDSIVAGRSPELIVKRRKRWLYADYFRDEPAPQGAP